MKEEKTLVKLMGMMITLRAMSSMTSRFGSGIGRLHRLHRRTKEALCLLICCCSEALGEDGVVHVTWTDPPAGGGGGIGMQIAKDFNQLIKDLILGNLVTKISIPSKDFSMRGTKFLTSSSLARSTNLFLKSVSPILNCRSFVLVIISLTSKIEETFEITSSSVISLMDHHTIIFH